MSPAATTPGTREEWIERAHDRTGLPRTLLRAIRSDGAPGTGRVTGDERARRRMTGETAALIAELVAGAGVNPIGRLYLVQCIRAHYGYMLGPAIAPAALTGAEAAFVRARAWELVEQARQERRGPVVQREGP